MGKSLFLYFILIVTSSNSWAVFNNNNEYRCDTAHSKTNKGQNIIKPSYGLTNYLDQNFSTMYYCDSLFTESNGGGYYLNYVDEGGSGMDSYPNVTIGGIKSKGIYTPGDKELVGMPERIENLSTELNFVWMTSQENAFDEDDKWMASINFIFDGEGTDISEPIASSRDFDIVVKSQSHNFKDDLNDLAKEETTRTAFWYFARLPDGSLRPYNYFYNGINYQYAVRYKFFTGAGDKDDKVHVKFIPFGPNGAPPVTKMNVVELIDASRTYYQYAALPQEQLALANEKVAKNGTWLKAINAGYEVYSGASILKTDKFKVNILNTDIVNNNTLKVLVSPNPSNGSLDVDLGVAMNETRINVRNILGVLVAKYEHLNGQVHQIDITGESGIYFIEVLSKKKRTVLKVIKT